MITPYKDNSSGKKEQVARMFNNIAHRYDFLNHFLSLGIDKIWRRKAIGYLKDVSPNPVILDVATGTGDFAVAALKLSPQKIVGIDISQEMLHVGIEKIRKRNLEHIIQLKKGDSENLEFDDKVFDGIIVAFGVRNFENLNQGLSEMYRVLKTNGKAVILEFSRPRAFPVKQIYNFYFRLVLPFIGKLVSKDNAAYTYLPESVSQFPEREDFIQELEKVGFKNSIFKPLSFGIASIYVAKK